MERMTLVTVDGCKLCDEIKTELNEADIEFDEVDFDTLLTEDPGRAKSILDACDAFGKKIFPMIEVGDIIFPPSYARRRVLEEKKKKTKNKN